MQTENNAIIEKYLKDNEISYQKDVTFKGVTVDYYIQSSKFAIIIKAGEGHKDRIKKARRLKMTDGIKKAIYFNPKNKDNLNKAFENCSAEYIRTGKHPIKQKENGTLTQYDIKFSEDAKRNPTREEMMTIEILDYHKMEYKFQEPMVINGQHYRPDFILPNKIILEIDGGYHNTKEQQDKDKKRDKNLRNYGYQIIRLSNEQIKEIHSKLAS